MLYEAGGHSVGAYMSKVELGGLADGGIGVERILDALPQGGDVHGGQYRAGVVVAVGMPGGSRSVSSRPGAVSSAGGRQARATRCGAPRSSNSRAGSEGREAVVRVPRSGLETCVV